VIGLPKKVSKTPVRTFSPSMELKADLRSFLIAHPDGYEEDDLNDLRIYIEAFYRMKLKKKELEALLIEEIKGIEGSKKALKMNRELLTPQDKILLGSCFCPACKRFKSYRKECPQCGHLEMTV
jgi:hypothetical protein